MHKPNPSSDQHQSNENSSNTGGEFIFNTMISLSKPESAEVPLSFSPGKNDRRSSNGLNPVMSMDLNIRSDDDFDFTPTAGDGGVQISNAKPGRVTTADYVAQNFPDIVDGQNFRSEEEPLKDAPSRPLKLERISTGDSVLPEKLVGYGRITSVDWKIGEFRDESSIAMKQLLGGPKPGCVGSLCSKLQRMSTADMDVEDCNTTPAIRLSSDMSADWVNDFKGEQPAALGPIRPSLFDEKANSDRKLLGVGFTVPLTTTTPTPMRITAAASTRSSTKKSSSSNAMKPSKKKRKKRVVDEGHICVPTDDDVLFGRGGYTNSHPGNIKFREKALELRPVYERSTKEEKYNISQMLLDSAISEGARFLEKGQDGEWHQVIGNGARKKASQALRERIKGTPRRKGVGASLASSWTSVQSANAAEAEAYFAQEINGHEINGDVLAI